MPTPETLRRRRTKIVATMGPSCNVPGVLDDLMAAGLDVARFNCSHGDYEEHSNRARLVQAAAARADRPIAMMFDLQGPKMRVMSPPMDLVPGQRVSVAGEGHPGDIVVSFDLDGVAIVPGDRVLLHDGRLQLDVLSVDADVINTVVVIGGHLGSRKGVNLPDSRWDRPVMSEKDVRDAAMAVELGAAYVALSFVQQASDADALRALLPKGVGIVAKIERPQAVANFEEIASAFDVVMVARGDLGVETPSWELTLLQKDLITRANRLGVPVITATEMLESMIESSRPTRAEVSDVTNAVLDGTDAIMLSAETAAGKYPALAVQTMAAIAEAADHSSLYPGPSSRQKAAMAGSRRNRALAWAAVSAARDLDAIIIGCFTETGKTARRIATVRPDVQIVAFTHDELVCRRMAMLRGVTPVLFERHTLVEDMIADASKELLARGLGRPGATVVYVAGPTNQAGGTNLLRVCEL